MSISWFLCTAETRFRVCGMMKCISLLRRVAIWLLRFRHRCGYGIHSPFAFAFVTGVIYEHEAYYAYEHLAEVAKGSALREKDVRLLFRVANFSEAHTALIVGKEVREALAALRAARPRCAVVEAPTANSLPSDGASYDFIYVDETADVARWANLLPQLASPCAVVVWRGIRQGGRELSAWRALQANGRVRVTFDLYDFGIACFESRLNKEDFIINYF